jgi:hypothetical protein
VSPTRDSDRELNHEADFGGDCEDATGLSVSARDSAGNGMDEDELAEVFCGLGVVEIAGIDEDGEGGDSISAVF